MNSTPPRGKAGRPAVLSHEGIVTAAITVIDTDGLEALTMRRLGTELGVRAMSLYRHLPSRDAVLSAVVNRLAAEATIDTDPNTPWPQALHRLATAYRRMLLGHPHAVPLLATHPVDIDIGLTLITGVLDRFHAAGITQEQALTAVQSVIVYVLGHALAQVGTPPGSGPQEPPPPAAAEYYDHWFSTGLEAILLGFQHQFAPR
jgi:AcrR family transcriptional regulator